MLIIGAVIILAAIFVVLPVTEKVISVFTSEHPTTPEIKPVEPPRHCQPAVVTILEPKTIETPPPPAPLPRRVPMPVMPPPPPKFTAELLSSLEWRCFEVLVMLYFQRTGRDAQSSRVGADGGVDLLIYQPGQTQPQACVQCKAWNVYNVGVKPVRELYGVMAADDIPKGYFITTGSFTIEASNFAQGKALVLIDGTQLLDALNRLPDSDRVAILEEVTEGDYTTPTCPQHDVKMVPRIGPKGPFWGCRHYPRCRQRFKMTERDREVAGYGAAD